MKRLDINVLELLAMNIGSFAFLRVAAERGVVVTHLVEFTDNTAAEHSVERGKPKSPRLGELVRQRYVALQAAGISASPERVASVDNDVADGLTPAAAQCWRTRSARWQLLGIQWFALSRLPNFTM